MGREQREQYLRYCRQPGIFSDSALRLTFRVLRKPKPALALLIQNLLNGVSVVRPEYSDCDNLSEYYRVDVTPGQLEDIVSSLVSAGGWKSGTCPAQQVMLKALLDDWRRLANAMDDDESVSR